MCKSLFFKKVVGLWLVTLFKKRVWHRCFPMTFFPIVTRLFKAVTLCKRIFFNEKSKKQEKETGTNFVLLSLSRNIIWKFMKTYLHRPIKTPQFLTPKNTPPPSWVVHITRGFCTCYFCSCVRSVLRGSIKSCASV